MSVHGGKPASRWPPRTTPPLLLEALKRCCSVDASLRLRLLAAGEVAAVTKACLQSVRHVGHVLCRWSHGFKQARWKMWWPEHGSYSTLSPRTNP